MMALPGESVNLHALAGFVLGFKSSCTFRVDSLGVGNVYDGACGKSFRKGRSTSMARTTARYRP